MHMRKKRSTIPYSRQHIHRLDIQAVERVLRSYWITQGPAIERFENALAKKAGTKYAVAFNSGTAALHGAYFAAGIKAGDEVLVPALTFAATANAALYLGAKPVFVDVHLDTGLIDLADAERNITKKTKAIVPVDYAGRPADLSSVRTFAKKNNLAFIEDGAQSLGAAYRGKPVGAQADMTMFSFHPVKSITTGEGGIITTDNPGFAQKMKMFRSHGITKDRNLFEEDGYGAWHQEMHALGYNYRMTDFQAALGESQLKRLGLFVAKRRMAAKRYEVLLRKIPGIIVPPSSKESAWHLYAVRLSPEIARHRDTVFAKLRAAGLGVQVHYLPVYMHPYYQKLGYKKRLCPNAESFSFSEISIPLFPGITKADQSYVADTIRVAITTVAKRRGK